MDLHRCERGLVRFAFEANAALDVSRPLVVVRKEKSVIGANGQSTSAAAAPTEFGIAYSLLLSLSVTIAVIRSCGHDNREYNRSFQCYTG